MPLWLNNNRLNFAYHDPIWNRIRMMRILASVVPRVMQKTEKILAGEGLEVS